MPPGSYPAIPPTCSHPLWWCSHHKPFFHFFFPLFLAHGLRNSARQHMRLWCSRCVCIRLATTTDWLAEASRVVAVKPRLHPHQLLWAATGNCSHPEEVFDEAEECQRRIPAGQCHTICSTSGLWHVLPAVALLIFTLRINTQCNNLDRSTLLFWIKTKI